MITVADDAADTDPLEGESPQEGTVDEKLDHSNTTSSNVTTPVTSKPDNSSIESDEAPVPEDNVQSEDPEESEDLNQDAESKSDEKSQDDDQDDESDDVKAEDGGKEEQMDPKGEDHKEEEVAKDPKQDDLNDNPQVVDPDAIAEDTSARFHTVKLMLYIVSFAVLA